MGRATRSGLHDTISTNLLSIGEIMMHLFLAMATCAIIGSSGNAAFGYPVEFLVTYPNGKTVDLGGWSSRPIGKYWIGIQCQRATPALRHQLGLSPKQGIVVNEVSKSSPSDGLLKQHDVLVEVNKKSIQAPRDLYPVIEKQPNSLEFRLVRRGRPLTITVKPEKRPKPKPIRIEVDHKLLTAFEMHQFEAPEYYDDFRLTYYLNRDAPDLPKDVTIAIEKSQKTPLRIRVKRKDESWNVTFAEISKLPRDLWPHVKSMFYNGVAELSDKNSEPQKSTQSAEFVRQIENLREQLKTFDEELQKINQANEQAN